MIPTFRRHLILVGLFVAWGTLTAAVAAGDEEQWPRLRGPFATGLPSNTENPNLPETWSRTENVAWQVEVPGVGWSSPVVWGNQVFLTTVTNDKEAENAKPQAGLYLGPGRKEIPSGEHEWLVFCFDLETGEEIWKRSARQGQPPVGRHPKSCYAAETPVTDGERLYVLFGDVGLFCYDLEGEWLWTHEIEPKKTQADYGAAASPVVHGDQVIYVYDNQEASYITSLDTRTGEENWRVPRIEKSTWATPFVWETEDRTEIVVCGKQKILSYDLEGKVLWSLKGYMSNLVIPSPFVADGLLYIASGYVGDMHRPAFAIKPGASGDMALEKGTPLPEAIQWYQPKGGPYNTTPLVYDGLYYLLLDRGMLAAYDAKTGEMKYDRTRFPPPASFTSSPWAYNGKVFCLGEDGKTFVVKAGPEFELLKVNDLGPDLCLACPAIVGGRLLIRTQRKLWCVAKPELHPGRDQ